MGLLGSDPFLTELHKMYERNKTRSVWITMKRSAMKRTPSKRIRPRKDGSIPPPLPPIPESEYTCLIRASDGKKHISTTVGASQHAKFQQSVSVIMKAHMDALKKREKVKPVKDGGAKDDAKK